jgi:hypothetical protein
MDSSFAQSSSSAAASSRSPSPATPEPYDSLEQVTIADLSWPPGKELFQPGISGSNNGSDDMLQFHDLIKESAYDLHTSYEREPATSVFVADATSPVVDVPASMTRASPLGSEVGAATLKCTKQRPRKREALSIPPNVVSPPKESCQG